MRVRRHGDEKERDRVSLMTFQGRQLTSALAGPSEGRLFSVLSSKVFLRSTAPPGDISGPLFSKEGKTWMMNIIVLPWPQEIGAGLVQSQWEVLMTPACDLHLFQPAPH